MVKLAADMPDATDAGQQVKPEPDGVQYLHFAMCSVFALLAKRSIWMLHADKLACPSIEIKTKQMGVAVDLGHILI